MDDAQFLEELRNDFFEEATTLINLLEENILEVEKDTSNKEAISEIFRAAHTIKGGAATLDLDRVSNFTHEMENLLDSLRAGEITVTTDIVDTLLKTIDILKTMLEKNKNNIDIEEGYEDDVLNEIKKHTYEDISPEQKREILEKVILEKKETKIDYKLNEYERYLIKNAVQEGNKIYEIFIILNDKNPMKTVSGIQIFSILRSVGEVVKSIPDMDELMDDYFSKEIYYLFISRNTEEQIKDKVFLSDVTDFIEITQYTEQDAFEEEDDDLQPTMDEIELTEEDGKSIITAIANGNNVYKLSVYFDGDNPMRSVSGLLFFTMLQAKGEIIKALPTFENLKKDIFYPKSIFIFSTTTQLEELKSKLYISDITKELKFQEFKYKKSQLDKDLLDNSSDKPKKTTTEVVGITTRSSAMNVSDITKKEDTITKDKEPITDINTISSIFQPKQTDVQPPKPKPQPPKPSKPQQPIKQEKKVSSMLRVESKRIDDVLNLLGELVISKASFLQINDANNSILESLTTTFLTYKKEIKSFFNELNTLLGQVEAEKQINEIVKEKQQELLTMFESILPDFKVMNEKLRSSSQGLSRITDDLHESVMKIRMVPINQIFSRFPRLIRDLNHELNKEIELVIEGEDTELDKGMVEDLIDPLIHIVRNSVDHGFELPEVREKKGKHRKGTLLLKAEHEGNMMVITIADDGQGISKEKIYKRAVEKKLIEPGLDISHEDAINLLFLPGFSTSEQITSLSGRGVGLDVVKRKVESINGNILIESEEGKFTRITIKIPLTLAIIQALLVNISNYIYSIPINSVIETQRIFPNEIELLEQNEVIRIRDEVVSLIRMDKVFRHLTEDEKDDYYVIIVGTSNKKLGLIVDGLIGEQDIVIKPLNNKYAYSPGIAGATILGDGQVSLIIDIPNLFEFIMSSKTRKLI